MSSTLSAPRVVNHLSVIRFVDRFSGSAYIQPSPRLTFIVVDDRQTFDAINLPLKHSDDLVLVKSVVSPDCTFVFQYWFTSARAGSEGTDRAKFQEGA